MSKSQKQGWFYETSSWTWHYFVGSGRASLCGGHKTSSKSVLQHDIPVKDHDSRCPECLEIRESS